MSGVRQTKGGFFYSLKGQPRGGGGGGKKKKKKGGNRSASVCIIKDHLRFISTCGQQRGHSESLGLRPSLVEIAFEDIGSPSSNRVEGAHRT